MIRFTRTRISLMFSITSHGCVSVGFSSSFCRDKSLMLWRKREQNCWGKIPLRIIRKRYVLSWKFNYNSAILLRILQVKETVPNLSPKKCRVFSLIFSIFGFHWPADKAWPTARADCPPSWSSLLFPDQAECSDPFWSLVASSEVSLLSRIVGIPEQSFALILFG